VKIDPTTMIKREKTEIMVIREIRPGGHVLARKKPKLRFFVKIDLATKISAENTPILFFREI
jgi:hypothetical protein